MSFSYRPAMRKLLPFALALAAAWHPAGAAEPSASGKRPNIIVIRADDMGYSNLGCYGRKIHYAAN